MIVFEPVPAYQEVMRLGLALNPGFADRVTIYGNVVYNDPGTYTLRVPIPSKIGRLKKLGMTGMAGTAVNEYCKRGALVKWVWQERGCGRVGQGGRGVGQHGGQQREEQGCLVVSRHLTTT